MGPSCSHGAGRGGHGGRRGNLQASQHAMRPPDAADNQPQDQTQQPTKTDAKSTIANADRLLHLIPEGQAQEAIRALINLARSLAGKQKSTRSQSDHDSINPEASTLQRIETKIDAILSSRLNQRIIYIAAALGI